MFKQFYSIYFQLLCFFDNIYMCINIYFYQLYFYSILNSYFFYIIFSVCCTFTLKQTQNYLTDNPFYLFNIFMQKQGMNGHANMMHSYLRKVQKDQSYLKSKNKKPNITQMGPLTCQMLLVYVAMLLFMFTSEIYTSPCILFFC